ncbi:hypothetical protein [Desulfovibrio subterraneus]|uniref:Uncharacterized protein n=1 Tax=Desulfovibrio subterraneus TaxID=2718620 RepID=A0A7J0BGT1_9BACT|nr:hypothetical protein [Desulfovibrio subterraneus]GFM32943.1 hypothetical protein DSM101010T_13080 [Desulfovibrio subterraneus]
MQDWAEKLLFVAAGAAAGALGLVAWQNRDRLHELLDVALDKGQELMKDQMQDLENMAAATGTTGATGGAGGSAHNAAGKEA